MIHPIVEGGVELLKIVTPGCYWIRCEDCEGTCRIPLSIKKKPHPDECYYPQQGEKVFVRDEDGFFYRGTISGRRSVPYPGCWRYVVQLTDTFQVKDFEQEEVYPTYGGPTVSCGSAHMVSLHNMLPQKPPDSYSKSINLNNQKQHKEFEDRVVKWDKLVKKILDIYSMTFSFVQSKVIRGSIYGEISFFNPVNKSEKWYNLAEYLEFENIAVAVTDRFNEVIVALMTKPLIDGSTLLPAFIPQVPTSGTKTTSQPSQQKNESARSDFDFTGFRVLEVDAAIHQKLWTGSSVNIIFKNAPLDHETIIRYVTPDGEIVLGTVMTVDVKFSETADYSLERLLPRLPKFLYPFDDDEYSEEYIPEICFKRLPPEFDDPVDPRTRLFDYDFEASRQHFLASGGYFTQPELSRADSSDAKEMIRAYLESLNVSSLHEWQKLCFPTLFNKAHLLVIGSQPMAKLTTCTVCSLIWMTLSKGKSHHKSVSPALIIFISNFERAKKVASLCVQSTDFKVILSTSLYISDKQEEQALNGCDVLITTPNNWAELVNRKIFDHRRLRHVIFDEFSKLLELNRSGIDLVFNEGLLGRRVEIIILSSGTCDLISDYLRKLTSVTICVVDPFLSMLCCGLKPNVVFSKEDDWVSHLENIIAHKRLRKRLLLCKNEEEGRLIVEKIRCEVVFVHENLPTDNAVRGVNDWSNDSDKLLVCTDYVFNQVQEMLQIKDVSFLICWKSNCLANLSSRFTAMTGLPERSKMTASAYIVCDSENFEELLIIEGISKNVNFVNGSLDEHLIAAASVVERGKVGPVCPLVFAFGKCPDFPRCSLRHLFLPDDDIKSFNTSNFLKVDILKVHSAFKYSARIHEAISNTPDAAGETLSTLMSNLEKIDASLEKSSENPPPQLLEIADIVGVKIERDERCLLRRATVKHLPGDDGLYTLNLIDYEEHDVHLPLSKLFTLPDNIACLPKDVVDLYISRLIPVDVNSDWKYDTCAYVENALNSSIFSDSQFLAGDVQFIAGRSIVVDSLHSFVHEQCQYVLKSLDNDSYTSLKDVILQSNYCAKNPKHLSQLSSILTESGLPPLPTHEGKYGHRTDLPTSLVPAVVPYFQDPGRLYVQLKEESEKLESLEKRISSAMDSSKRKLPLVALHELCVVYNDGEWNRAVVEDIIRDQVNECTSVCVVFVDFGDSRLIRLDELHDLPTEFREVPFFAVESELVGILPFTDQWHEETTLYFESRVREEGDVMKDLLVAFCGLSDGEIHRSDPIWKYRAVLKDPSGSEEYTINFDIARKGLAAFDPVNKHLMKNPTKKIDGAVDVNVTHGK